MLEPPGGAARLSYEQTTREATVKKSIAAITAFAFGIGAFGAGQAETPPPHSPAAKQEAQRLAALPAVGPQARPVANRAGRKEKGRVSYYAPKFSGRKMADGRRMNPRDNVAASKTLPLGSIVKVTNLKTGDTATVKIQDRGPFVNGRVIDVSSQVADRLDLKKDGTAAVEVKPITIPQPDGGVKLGAGAAESSPREIEQAVETTKDLVAKERQ